MDKVPLETRPLPQPGLRWAGPDEGPPARRQERHRGRPRRAAIDEAALWQEKLIGPSNLRPVSFLARGIALSRAVAHITLPGVGAGTGFLVADDLLLTNGHVFPDEATAGEAIVRFNYEDTLSGRPKKVDTYRCRPAEGFHTSPYLEEGVAAAALDYSVVRLDGKAGSRWGRIVLAPREVGVPQDVVIIQHPGGDPPGPSGGAESSSRRAVSMVEVASTTARARRMSGAAEPAVTTSTPRAEPSSPVSTRRTTVDGSTVHRPVASAAGSHRSSGETDPNAVVARPAPARA